MQTQVYREEDGSVTAVRLVAETDADRKELETLTHAKAIHVSGESRPASLSAPAGESETETESYPDSLT